MCCFGFKDTRLSNALNSKVYNLFKFEITLPHNPDFDNPEKEIFGNIVGKEGNAGNQCFLPHQRQRYHRLCRHSFCHLQMLLN